MSKHESRGVPIEEVTPGTTVWHNNDGSWRPVETVTLSDPKTETYESDRSNPGRDVRKRTTYWYTLRGKGGNIIWEARTGDAAVILEKAP